MKEIESKDVFLFKLINPFLLVVKVSLVNPYMITLFFSMGFPKELTNFISWELQKVIKPIRNTKKQYNLE